MFTAEYKRRILAKADACPHREVGALLRQEGLYSRPASTAPLNRIGQDILIPRIHMDSRHQTTRSVRNPPVFWAWNVKPSANLSRSGGVRWLEYSTNVL